MHVFLGLLSALRKSATSPPTPVVWTANTRANGNKYLSWAFVEAANFALRYCPEAKRFFERKRTKVKNVVAIKALAHKLARACYHMLKEGKPFDVKRCFA